MYRINMSHRVNPTSCALFLISSNAISSVNVIVAFLRLWVMRVYRHPDPHTHIIAN